MTSYGCDGCNRDEPCIVNGSTSYAGDYSLCCRCRYAADADGWCDECRPADDDTTEAA